MYVLLETPGKQPLDIAAKYVYASMVNLIHKLK